MFKRPKEKSVRPEGQDFSKNIIFEVLTLCGSNLYKKNPDSFRETGFLKYQISWKSTKFNNFWSNMVEMYVC